MLNPCLSRAKFNRAELVTCCQNTLFFTNWSGRVPEIPETPSGSATGMVNRTTPRPSTLIIARLFTFYNCKQHFRRSSEIHVVSQLEHHTIISVNFATWREWPIDVSFYPEMTGKPKWCTSQSESAFPLFPWTYIFILRRRGSLGWDLQIHLQSTPHVGINVVPLKDVRCFNWEFRNSQSKLSCNLAANSRPN